MSDDNNKDNIQDDNGNEESELTLDSVLEMSAEEITDEHRSFLSEHSDELSDDDLDYYKVERKPTIPDPYTDRKDDDGKDKDKGEDDELLIDGEPVDPAQVKVMEKIIEKRVGSKLSDIESRVGGSSKVREVDSFVNENPDFQPYREAMIRFVNANPRYAALDAEELAAVVARKDLVKIGARRERQTIKKASESKSPGRTIRPEGKRGQKDWANMTSEEYFKERQKELGHI